MRNSLACALVATIAIAQQIQVADWTEADVLAWAETSQTKTNELAAEWANAFGSFQDAVAKPADDFRAQAEDIYAKGLNASVQADEDVINFVAQNIFVDGGLLSDEFPQIGEYLTTVRQEADTFEEMFNLDALSITDRNLEWTNLNTQEVSQPVTLQSYDDWDQQYYDTFYYEEPNRIGEKLEPIVEKIGQQVVSYGFDPEVVKEWFSKNGQTWEQINKRHEQEAAEVAQAQVQEASNFVRGIIDNAVADMKQKVTEGQSELEQMLDERAAEYKTEIERQTNATISDITRFFEDSFNTLDDSIADFNINDLQNSNGEMINDDEWIMMAAKGDEQESTNFGFMGCGALALGAVATIVYLQKKKQGKAEADEQFVRV